MRENDCTKDWKSTRIAMGYLGADSGESVDKAQGAMIGAVSILVDTHHLKQYDAVNYLIRLLPNDFRIECIPYEWLGLDAPIKLEMLAKVTSFSSLWTCVPSEEKEKHPGLREDLLARYISVVSVMINHSRRAEEPELKLFPFTLHGTQWIADFVVYDMKKEYVPGRSNWHGQNPSQWQFAGCICLQDGRVSVHT